MGVGVTNDGVNGSRGKAHLMAEINVTPFVDVMLVLLIVFMVAAPLLTVGVTVDLPEAQSNPISETGEPLSVTIQADGTIFVQETMVELDNLIPRLEAIAEAGYDQRIYVRGDKAANYGEVMTIMGRINSAGFRSLALVTEQEN